MVVMRVVLRPATSNDAELLLEWRNDRETRASSRSTAPVSAAEHERWLATTLARADRRLYVGLLDGEPCGFARLDLEEGGEAEISVAVAPKLRERGVGRSLIRAAAAAAFDAEIRRVRAEIKPDNAASLRAFESVGFEREESRNGMIVMVLANEPPSG